MDAAPLLASKDGLVLVVWMVPGANRTESAGVYGDALKIRVAAAASEGAANEALLRFLSRRLGWTWRLFRVVSRARSEFESTVAI